MQLFLMCLVWFIVWTLLSFSQDEHDAVKAVRQIHEFNWTIANSRQIHEFNWTIAKLKSFIESWLGGQNTRLTQY